MGRIRRHKSEYGRARASRSRDRAQLEFDDMLIEQFFSEGDLRDARELRKIPVRFGSPQLADHLSDSTLAAAILESGDLESEAGEPVECVEAPIEELEKLVAQEETAPVVPRNGTNGDQAKPVPVVMRGVNGRSNGNGHRTMRALPVVQRPDSAERGGERFSPWGVVKGFLIGTAAAAAVMLVIRVIW